MKRQAKTKTYKMADGTTFVRRTRVGPKAPKGLQARGRRPAAPDPDKWFRDCKACGGKETLSPKSQKCSDCGAFSPEFADALAGAAAKAHAVEEAGIVTRGKEGVEEAASHAMGALLSRVVRFPDMSAKYVQALAMRAMAGGLDGKEHRLLYDCLSALPRDWLKLVGQVRF